MDFITLYRTITPYSVSTSVTVSISDRIDMICSNEAFTYQRDVCVDALQDVNGRQCPSHSAAGWLA